MINLNDYPKSKAKFLVYVKKWLIDFQKELLKGSNLPDDQIPKVDDKLAEDAALNIVYNNMRSLYNFFDKEGIYMTVVDPLAWKWRIVANDNHTEGNELKSRDEAELEGFEECFKVLELTIS